MARAAFKTAQQSWPKEGNRELPIIVSFAGGNIVTDDLTPEMQASQIESIQSVWIDNSANPSAFRLTLLGPTSQFIKAAPFSQGVYPVISPGLLRYSARSDSYNGNVTLIFSNSQKHWFTTDTDPRASATRTPLNFQNLAAGDNTILAATALKYNYLFRINFDVAAATNLQFFNGPSVNGLSLSGLMTFAANGSLYLPYDTVPHFLTGQGNALILNSSAAVGLGGEMLSITA
jgi:hypothetical protein